MSWPVVKLGDVVDFIGGAQPPKSDFIYEEQEGYIRLLQIRDYKSDDNLTYIPISKARRFCSAEDVMIGRYGPPVFQILRGLEGSYNVALMKAEPSKKVDKNYLFYFLKQDKLFRLIDGLSQRTAGQSGIDMNALKSYPMLLPSLTEQKRIAAILDKADAIRRKRQQAIQLADEFLRSVFLDMFGDIPAKKSKYQFLGCRGYVLASSGKSSRDVFSEIPTEIPIYGGNGVNGYATRSLYDEPVIVLGRVGQQCAITNLTSGPAWVTDNAIVVQVTDSSRYNPVYLAYAFMHSPIRDTVTRLDLPFINQSMILDAPIPLPPIELQNKFEKIREKTFQLIRGFTESAGKTQSCFSALSQKAFSGEL